MASAAPSSASLLTPSRLRHVGEVPSTVAGVRNSACATALAGAPGGSQLGDPALGGGQRDSTSSNGGGGAGAGGHQLVGRPAGRGRASRRSPPGPGPRAAATPAPPASLGHPGQRQLGAGQLVASHRRPEQQVRLAQHLDRPLAAELAGHPQGPAEDAGCAPGPGQRHLLGHQCARLVDPAERGQHRRPVGTPRPPHRVHHERSASSAAASSRGQAPPRGGPRRASSRAWFSSNSRAPSPIRCWSCHGIDVAAGPRGRRPAPAGCR